MDATTGTIALRGTSVLRFGGHAEFDTTVAGLRKGYVYVRVLAEQAGQIVYQSSEPPGFVFPLVDQAGQGLEWPGGPADVTAELVHRIDGRRPTVRTLAMVSFTVEG